MTSKKDRILKVLPSGHGHYKVTIQRYTKTYSAIIDNMEAIDDYKTGKESAAVTLYDMVCWKNNINY